MAERSRRERIDEAVRLKKSRNLSEAVQLLESLVAEDPADSYAAGHLAHTLLLKALPREALALADEVLARDPGSAFVHYVRGDALVRLRRYEDAVLSLEAAIDGGFPSAFLYSRLAQARARAGDKEGARRTLEKGLGLYPGDGQLLLALGRLEKTSGEREAAERHIEEAARKLPGDAFVAKELYATRARAKGPSLAAAELQKLLRIPSQAKNPHLHDELARLLVEQRDFDAAVAAAERAHELAPESRLLHQRLGHVLVKAGRDAHAVQVFEACLERDPENPTLNKSYVAARRRLGQLDEAHAFYLVLLRHHPEAKKIFGWLRRVARAAEPSEGS